MSERSTVVSVPAEAAPADLVGTSIVIVSAFDPMLLQPANLASNGLLAESDLAQLRYDILAPELSVLRLPWMQVILEPTKLSALSTPENPMAEPVRDFVFGLLDTLKIKHVTAVGFNHDTHFAVPSEEAWHKIGHLLAPKEAIWRKVLKDPGTLSLSIRGRRDDDLGGQVNVKVEPSLRIHPGIYINVNDHLTAGNGPRDTPEQLIDVAGENWGGSKRRSDEVVAAIKGLL
jgi:hypothetical protein